MRDVADALYALRSQHCFPIAVRTASVEFARAALGVMFPHFSDRVPCDSDELLAELESLRDALRGIRDALRPLLAVPDDAPLDGFLADLPDISRALAQDARAIYQGDPAAASVDEVILTYPGFYAIAVHRLAHALHGGGFPLLPRLLAEHAHERTGVDIHPGATIGRAFVIDHGTGVVVGETAVIGNGVKLYQGVTLGALSVEKRLAQRKRHPTLGDHVVVYANATILGGETTIGHDTVIGGNAWVTSSVPPFSMVGRNAEVRPRRPGEEGELEFHI